MRPTLLLTTTALLLCLSGCTKQTSETIAAQHCTIRLAGDSTMQIVDPAKNPDFGWGQVLPDYLAEGAQVTNYAKGGRSTKTFLSEGRWDKLLSDSQPGDWVLIQFGHNDASYAKPERYTAPVDFEANLRRFVRAARAKQTQPVLITPVVRRHFDSEGKLRDMHGIYPSLVTKVATEMQVPLIDLFAISSAAILEKGVAESASWFAHVAPGEHSCCEKGREDNTHFSFEGAHKIASLVVSETIAAGPQPLAACFKQSHSNSNH